MAYNAKDHTLPKQTILCETKNYKIYVKIILGVDENGNPEERYVTDIEYSPKTFYYKHGKKAYEFPSIGYALDFIFAVAVNGYCAKMEMIPTWNGNFDQYITNKGEVE